MCNPFADMIVLHTVEYPCYQQVKYTAKPVTPAKAMDLCQNLRMNQFSEEKLQKTKNKKHFPGERWGEENELY